MQALVNIILDTPETFGAADADDSPWFTVEKAGGGSVEGESLRAWLGSPATGAHNEDEVSEGRSGGWGAFGNSRSRDAVTNRDVTVKKPSVLGKRSDRRGDRAGESIGARSLTEKAILMVAKATSLTPPPALLLCVRRNALGVVRHTCPVLAVVTHMDKPVEGPAASIPSGLSDVQSAWTAACKRQGRLLDVVRPVVREVLWGSNDATLILHGDHRAASNAQLLAPGGVLEGLLLDVVEGTRQRSVPDFVVELTLRVCALDSPTNTIVDLMPASTAEMLPEEASAAQDGLVDTVELQIQRSFRDRRSKTPSLVTMSPSVLRTTHRDERMQVQLVPTMIAGVEQRELLWQRLHERSDEHMLQALAAIRRRWEKLESRPHVPLLEVIVELKVGKSGRLVASPQVANLSLVAVNATPQHGLRELLTAVAARRSPGLAAPPAVHTLFRRLHLSASARLLFATTCTVRDLCASVDALCLAMGTLPDTHLEAPPSDLQAAVMGKQDDIRRLQRQSAAMDAENERLWDEILLMRSQEWSLDVELKDAQSKAQASLCEVVRHGARSTMKMAPKQRCASPITGAAGLASFGMRSVTSGWMGADSYLDDAQTLRLTLEAQRESQSEEIDALWQERCALSNVFRGLVKAVDRLHHRLAYRERASKVLVRRLGGERLAAQRANEEVVQRMQNNLAVSKAKATPPGMTSSSQTAKFDESVPEQLSLLDPAAPDGGRCSQSPSLSLADEMQQARERAELSQLQESAAADLAQALRSILEDASAPFAW